MERFEKIVAVLEEIVAKLIAMFKQTSEWFKSLEETDETTTA